MTDLFSRIAERALELASTIQPMVTPFYAATQPQEGSDLFFEALSDETWSAEGEQARATTGQHSREPEQQEPTRLPEPERPRRLEHAHSTETPSLPQHAPIPGQPPLPQQTSAPVYPSLPYHVRELEQQSYPQQIRHEHASVYRNVEYPPVTELPRTEYPTPPGYPQGVPLLYTARFASSEAVNGGRTNIVGAGQPEDMGQTGDGKRARIVGVPLAGTLGRVGAVPSQTEQHTNETKSEGTQPPPTVHVTIGRIEVRATPAPTTQAQAQRQPAAPKAMSLDEYLKQSGKGGRG